MYMRGLINTAYIVDKIHPILVDRLDCAMSRFSKDLNNRALDDRVEFFADDVIIDNEYLSSEVSNTNINEKLHKKSTSSDTVNFLVNFFAKEFLLSGSSINHTLYNMLYLMNQLGLYPDEIYINDIFREFKTNVIDVHKYDLWNKSDHMNIGRYVDLLIKYEFPYISYLRLPHSAKKDIKKEDIKKDLEGEGTEGIVNTGLNWIKSQATLIGGSILSLIAANGGKLSSSGMKITDIVKVAYSVGFRGESLIEAVAIAMGESQGDANAVGDIKLAGIDKRGVNWGPSVGLWQIRTIVDQTNTGGIRDIEILTDPKKNAQSAWAISGGGKNWNPWTVWKEGTYKKHMQSAENAVNEFLNNK
jgi:hypothetical protein